MGKRIWLRLVFAAITVAFFACPPDESPIVGEFPVLLQSGGAGAYLVTWFRERDPTSYGSSLRLFELEEQANPTRKASLTVGGGSYFGRAPVAAAIIERQGGPTVFGFEYSGYNEAWAYSFSATQAAKVRVNIQYASPVSLIDRGDGRMWMFASRSRWFSDEAHTPLAPLVEFKDDTATVLEKNVVWAKCAGDYCQQLRISGSTLRLFASPVSNDAYAHSVTSVGLESFGYLEPGEHVYRSCESDGRTLFVIDNGLFSLSSTEPALTLLANLAESSFLLRECDPHESEPSDSGPLSAGLPSGRVIEAHVKSLGAVDEPTCLAHERALIGCETLYYDNETRIILRDIYNAVLRSYTLDE